MSGRRSVWPVMRTSERIFVPPRMPDCSNKPPQTPQYTGGVSPGRRRAVYGLPYTARESESFFSAGGAQRDLLTVPYRKRWAIRIRTSRQSYRGVHELSYSTRVYKQVSPDAAGRARALSGMPQ